MSSLSPILQAGGRPICKEIAENCNGAIKPNWNTVPVGEHGLEEDVFEGKYLSEWRINLRRSSLHFVQIGEDRMVVTFDRLTHKMLKYDLDGRLIYG